ncbi:MAG: hypothetical protein ACFFFH_08670 [Candidatus Thorarchaeota archaeon]
MVSINAMIQTGAIKCPFCGKADFNVFIPLSPSVIQTKKSPTIFKSKIPSTTEHAAPSEPESEENKRECAIKTKKRCNL